MIRTESHLQQSQSTLDAQKRGAESAARAKSKQKITGYNSSRSLTDQVEAARASVGGDVFQQNWFVRGLVYLGDKIANALSNKS